MNFSSFLRIFVFAGKSFWRNFWLSIVTITIIILTFISINFLIVINVLSDASITLVKDKVDVSVYFKPDITEPQVQEVQSYLSSLAQVKDIQLVSQKEALDRFRANHQDDADIISSLDELGANPIGATIRIKAREIGDYPMIMQVLTNSKYNTWILDKNFDDHEAYIQKIQTLAENIRKVGLITSGVFIIIALLIVFNTIRVAIYTHRQEIIIMKLVGATDWFIRSPFLVEAIMYGVIACSISLAIMYPLLNVVQPYINDFFLSDQFNIKRYFIEHWWQIFGLELLVAILLNMISSSIAVRRYLRNQTSSRLTKR